jgi:hypothetical protein
MTQHPIFKKYTRDWLHDQTGYSKIYLSRVASGRVPLSKPFVDRMAYKLQEPAEALFVLNAVVDSSAQNPSKN